MLKAARPNDRAIDVKQVKENENIKNLVFVVATALKLCDIVSQSRLPHETQKCVVVVYRFPFVLNQFT